MDLGSLELVTGMSPQHRAPGGHRHAVVKAFPTCQLPQNGGAAADYHSNSNNDDDNNNENLV